MQDTTNTRHEHGERLVDRSSTGRVRPWKEHKMTSRAVAASLMRIWNAHPRKNLWAKKRGILMSTCGDYLAFGEHVDPETGELTRRLDAANFCRDRLCPTCQWRKSLVMFAQLSTIMDAIEAEKPGVYTPIFLTLTMKNVQADGLSAAIDKILKAWSRMMNKAGNRKPYQVNVGWFRALEVTYNAEADTWHPHIHAILLVESDYFTDPDKYIDHDSWVAEWRRALGADYDPSVDVRRVKNSRSDAVAEVAKYAVKPGEWVCDDRDATDAHVELLATVLKGRRLVAFGGLMMQVRKQLKQEDAEKADLVHTSPDELRSDVRIALDRYEWQAGVTNDYVLVERTEMNGGSDAGEE